MGDSQNVAWAIPIIFFVSSMILWCICCCASNGCKPPIYDSSPPLPPLPLPLPPPLPLLPLPLPPPPPLSPPLIEEDPV